MEEFVSEMFSTPIPIIIGVLIAFGILKKLVKLAVFAAIAFVVYSIYTGAIAI